MIKQAQSVASNSNSTKKLMFLVELHEEHGTDKLIDFVLRIDKIKQIEEFNDFVFNAKRTPQSFSDVIS